jgi:hypothetical protein
MTHGCARLGGRRAGCSLQAHCHFIRRQDSPLLRAYSDRCGITGFDSGAIMKVVGALILASGLFASSANAVTYTFDLNGTYQSNEVPWVSLTPMSGTLGPTGYTFGANQGLRFQAALLGTNYSIETRFRFDTTSGFRRIIDFNDLLGDRGLYNKNSDLAFYDVTEGSSALITDGTDVTVRLTRGSNFVTGYVNGISQFGFGDGGGLATATGLWLTFFADNGGEASSGFADSIRITSDIAAPPGAVVPIPGALPLFATGLGVLAFLARRRKQKQAAA